MEGACRATPFAPGTSCAPENCRCPAVSMACVHSTESVAAPRRHPSRGSRPRRLSPLTVGEGVLGGPAPDQSETTSSQPNPFAGSARLPRKRLCHERARHLKRDLVPQDVITGPRELVRHGFQRHELRRVCGLTLVEPAD